jgi:hypothetical protein
MVNQAATEAAAAFIPNVSHDERIVAWGTKIHRQVSDTSASGGITVLAAAPFLARHVFDSQYFTSDGRLQLPNEPLKGEDGTLMKPEAVLRWRTDAQGKETGKHRLRDLLLLGASGSIPALGLEPVIGPSQLDVKFNPTIMKSNVARGTFKHAISHCKKADGKSRFHHVMVLVACTRTCMSRHAMVLTANTRTCMCRPVHATWTVGSMHATASKHMQA